MSVTNFLNKSGNVNFDTFDALLDALQVAEGVYQSSILVNRNNTNQNQNNQEGK